MKFIFEFDKTQTGCSVSQTAQITWRQIPQIIPPVQHKNYKVNFQLNRSMIKQTHSQRPTCFTSCLTSSCLSSGLLSMLYGRQTKVHKHINSNSHNPNKIKKRKKKKRRTEKRKRNICSRYRGVIVAMATREDLVAARCTNLASSSIMLATAKHPSKNQNYTLNQQITEKSVREGERCIYP